MTQKEQILAHMKLTGGITTKQAYDNFGCTRLSARIWDLRHDGWSIKEERITVTTRTGKRANVVRYSLDE